MTEALGTSLMPNIGIHTQITPPTTSINERRANSADGRYFAPRLYKIKPDATRESL
jgi:hypothetical protein